MRGSLNYERKTYAFLFGNVMRVTSRALSNVILLLLCLASPGLGSVSARSRLVFHISISPVYDRYSIISTSLPCQIDPDRTE
jgi:hypothetical protein